MRSLNVVNISIAEGDQFLGTEFAAAINRRKSWSNLKVVEISLNMGSELKTWEITKLTSEGVDLTLARSNTSGVPGPTADTDVLLLGDSAATYLQYGDVIKIVTTDATSAMRAQIYLEEI